MRFKLAIRMHKIRLFSARRTYSTSAVFVISPVEQQAERQRRIALSKAHAPRQIKWVYGIRTLWEDGWSQRAEGHSLFCHFSDKGKICAPTYASGA